MKHLTSKTALPVKHFLIENTGGRKVVLPYSLRANVDSIVDVLGIELRVVRQAGADARAPGILATTGKLIPASWFVDLSADVELTDEEALI